MVSVSGDLAVAGFREFFQNRLLGKRKDADVNESDDAECNEDYGSDDEDLVVAFQMRGRAG